MHLFREAMKRIDSPMAVCFTRQRLTIPYLFMNLALASDVAIVMPAYRAFRLQARIQMDEDV